MIPAMINMLTKIMADGEITRCDGKKPVRKAKIRANSNTTKIRKKSKAGSIGSPSSVSQKVSFRDAYVSSLLISTLFKRPRT